MSNHDHHRLSAAGVFITLGIIFGDIGTSPLYVMKAVVGEGQIIDRLVVLGGVSLVFWTLTIQTTLKYVWLVLRADNKGEGGIFSLYSLVKRRQRWLMFPALLGGAAVLAEGMITPPITVSSAIEGLAIRYPGIPTIPITVTIICLLFFIQRFGTAAVGKGFGPVMFVWFTMLGVLGVSKQALNGPLRQLVEAGLVGTATGTHDKRSKLLSLTEAGAALEAELSGTQMDLLEEAFTAAGPGAEQAWRALMGTLGGPG